MVDDEGMGRIEMVDLQAQYADLKASIDHRIHQVLAHGRYILGPEVTELEERLAEFCGVAHAVTVSSGTDALLAALMALDVGSGDEVITTPFSFAAASEVIALLGAKPVFVDIDPHTFNIDPRLIEQAITPRTRAIIPVSLYGQCADIDAINAIAAPHDLPVIEDAGQSFGATYKGRKSCALTTVACTSFYPAKPLGCYGDGGACFTNDAEVAERIRQIRDHGQSGRCEHVRIGLNARLDTIQAAVLLAKLEDYPRDLLKRKLVAQAYNERLGALAPKLLTPAIEGHNTTTYAQYTVKVTDRSRVRSMLTEAGIATAVHYPRPLYRQPAFATYVQPGANFPNTEAAADQVLSLPMHPYLDESALERICNAVISAVQAT